MLTTDEHLSLRQYYPCSPFQAPLPQSADSGHFCFTLAHLPRKSARVFCFASRFCAEKAFPDFSTAYGDLSNACIAQTTAEGTAHFQLQECPGVYRNSAPSAAAAVPPIRDIQPRHVHLVFWDGCQNRWEEQVYTKPIDVFVPSYPSLVSLFSSFSAKTSDILVLSLSDTVSSATAAFGDTDRVKAVPFSLDDTAEDFCDRIEEFTEDYYDTDFLGTLAAVRDRPIVLALAESVSASEESRMKTLILAKRKIERAPWKFCNVFLLLRGTSGDRPL